MLVDTSAIVCIALAEKNARWVAVQLDGAKGKLKMSTVNLAEAIIVVDYQHPTAASGLQTLLANTPIEFIAPTTQHAFIVADALAVTENLPSLTLGSDFRAVEVRAICVSASSQK